MKRVRCRASRQPARDSVQAPIAEDEPLGNVTRASTRDEWCLQCVRCRDSGQPARPAVQAPIADDAPLGELTRVGARNDRSGKRARWYALTLLWFALSGGVARAQPMAADAIQLDLVDCDGVSVKRVRELVALEVKPRTLLAAGSSQSGATHAQLSCHAGVASIVVRDAAAGAPLRLEIALRELAAVGRPRSLALALSELIATSRLRRAAANPASASSAVAAKPLARAEAGRADKDDTHPRSENQAADPPDARSRTEIQASSAERVAADRDGSRPRKKSHASSAEREEDARPGSEAQARLAERSEVQEDGRQRAGVAAPLADSVVPPEQSTAAGEGVSSGAQLWLGAGASRIAAPSGLAPLAAAGFLAYWGAIALAADVRYEHAEQSLRAAKVQLDAGSLALVPALRLQGAASEWLIGPGVRAGIASLRGTSTDESVLGQSVTGFWFAPCVQLALQLRFARRWALRAAAEAAYVTRTLSGFDQHGTALLELRGLALAAQLGVSWDVIPAH